MHILRHIRKIVFGLILLMGLPVAAQDRMAVALPIDNKLWAIDSLSIKSWEIKETSDLWNLYPSWTNEYTRYKIDLNGDYDIDLRGFHMPCDSRIVTSHFGYRASFKRNHYGTDIKVYVGDTIRAAFDGKVRVVDYEGKGYGNYVIIRHPNGLETLYGHMSKNLVKPNQDVRAGQPIGLGGNTGRSTGSHLHFETRFLGEFIDPEKLFSFEAADARADSYVFRSRGKSTLSGTHNLAAREEKANESRQFQQQKKERTSRSTVHKVKKGETLSSIAKKYHTTVDKLCRLNHISKSKALRVGQIIKCS